MLDDTFKERVRSLVHSKFEECAERARENYSRRSAELASKGHVYSGATLRAQNEARVKEKQEQIDIAWEAVKQVVAAQRIPCSATLGQDLKAEVEHYASYQLSGVKIQVREGDEKLERQLQQEFESKRERALTKVKAEIDLFVDGLRTASQPTEAKELEQNFKILLSRNQAKKDFEGWAEALRTSKRSIAVLFVDIDHFKRLNETYTHATIDRTLLPQFMVLLKDIVQFRGEGYRYGGEEFLLILPNHDSEEAKQFAERLLGIIQTCQFDIDGKFESVTVSIGIAICPQHGTTYEDILQKANDTEAIAKAQRNTARLA
jgi:diguanylate cyclase (GGDEF)-like protein